MITPQEEIFVHQCEIVYESIRQNYNGMPGQQAICLDALRKQIDKLKGVPEAKTQWDDKMAILIGLTFDDMRHLYNGGTVSVNSGDPGSPELPAIPIIIFLGGTHEHMAKGMEKHPDTPHQFTDSHKDAQN